MLCLGKINPVGLLRRIEKQASDFHSVTIQVLSRFYPVLTAHAWILRTWAPRRGRQGMHNHCFRDVDLIWPTVAPESVE